MRPTKKPLSVWWPAPLGAWVSKSPDSFWVAQASCLPHRASRPMKKGARKREANNNPREIAENRHSFAPQTKNGKET